MTPSAPTELASRENGSISVALFWDESTDELLVTVADAASGGFALEIDGASALDAFYHPYAYASRLGIAFADPLAPSSAGDMFDVAEVVL